MERKAQRLIEADPARRPTFTDFTQQINKMFPDDVEARREAFAYYGAYFNAIDTRGTTLSDAKLRGDAEAAAKEAEKAKASPPPPPPPPLPPPLPPANEPVPPPPAVEPEEMMEFYTQAPEPGLTPPPQPAISIEERKLDEERELFLQMLESDIEERRRNGR